jgi:hypothetical protein
MLRRFVVMTVIAVSLLAGAASGAYCLDSFKFMVDRSTLRCPGGVVSVEAAQSVVLEKCGEPDRIVRKKNVGPVWVYTFRDDRFMYYLVMLHGRLQRIASAPCDRQRYDCFDLR